jgi:hypothetical protein
VSSTLHVLLDRRPRIDAFAALAAGVSVDGGEAGEGVDGAAVGAGGAGHGGGGVWLGERDAGMELEIVRRGCSGVLVWWVLYKNVVVVPGSDLTDLASAVTCCVDHLLADVGLGEIGGADQ